MDRDNTYLKGNQHAKGNKPNATCFKSGQAPWNKGKKTKPLTPELIEIIRKTNLGNSYGKGYKHTEKAKRSMSLKRIGNKNALGAKMPERSVEQREAARQKAMGHSVSLETREKLSKIFKGRVVTQEWKDKIRAGVVLRTPKFRDTSIEKKVEAELLKRSIDFKKQRPLCKVAVVDFFLPDLSIVIQCDGDYWHNRPSSQERDQRQDKALTEEGFKVYRFWEHEINASVECCIDKIYELSERRQSAR